MPLEPLVPPPDRNAVVILKTGLTTLPWSNWFRDVHAWIRQLAAGIFDSGITFPDPPNPSTNPRTLDDYEEGTWTPVLLGTGGQSGQVYAAQHGYFVKVGKLVTVGFRVQLSTLGTITGTVRIGNLPFTSLNQANYRATGAMNWVNTTATFTTVFSQITPNLSAMDVLGAKAAQTSAVLLVQGDLANTTVLAGALPYIAET